MLVKMILPNQNYQSNKLLQTLKFKIEEQK